VVRLNGNSQLRYKASWKGKSREVWLDGEAFFNVTHTENHQQFLVHLSDKKDIEVLGTEFNVSDRTTGSYIVLKSGKIKLNLPEHTDSNTNNIYLQPGDLVEVLAEKNQKNKIKKRVVNPQMYYAWTKGKWMLDATSLEEMLQRLQETYGITTVVSNKDLLKRRASGSIPLPAENVETLITDIANLFELKIHKQDKHIYLDSIR
jgi:ferric-dicitrate binding protein FerR (iron transport regulator)